MSNRTLALQLKRLGDLILTAPALQSIRAAKPDVRITVAIDSAAAPLRPLFSSCVDDFLVYHKRRPNIRLWRDLTLTKYQACIDFSGTDRSALMTRLSNADIRLTSRKLGGKSLRRPVYNQLVDTSVRELHTVDYHQAFLPPLGIDTDTPPPSPGLRIPDDTVAEVDALLSPHGLDGKPFALIHPGTARAEKYWPPENWATVIACLVDAHHLPSVITGSPRPDEQAHIAEIKAALRVPVTDLSTGTTLLHLAELTRRSRLALGVDSVAMHLAAAFERPQIVLFGPTNPHHWRPRHPNATVLLAGNPDPVTSTTPRHPAAPMAQLPPTQVVTAIDASLPKIPVRTNTCHPEERSDEGSL